MLKRGFLLRRELAGGPLIDFGCPIHARILRMSGNEISWTIDVSGNATGQTPTGGSCYPFSTSCQGTNNRLAAYSYDAAGNVIYDGTHHYLYDALGRLLSVDNGSTASYVYNENGQRVRKNTSSGWTDYFYGIDGNVESEWNGSSWPNQYVYDGARLLAIYTNGTTGFIHADHLGSTRLVTGVSQIFTTRK